MADKSVLIASLGTLINIGIQDDNRTIKLESYKVDKIDSSIRKIGNAVIWQPSSKHSITLQSIVCAACVVSNPLLIRLPFFVVIAHIEDRKRQKSAKSIVLLTFFNGKICMVQCLSLPWQDEDSLYNYQFHLFDGPTILMLDNKRTNLFICSTESNPPFKRLDLSVAFGEQSKNDLELPWIKCFAANSFSKALCAIVQATIKEVFFTHQEKLLHECLLVALDDIMLENQSAKSDNKQETRITPPKLYWPLITAFILFDMEDLCTRKRSGASKTKNQKIYSAVATENKQFLVFDGNNSLLCCSIPFNDCSGIKLVKLPNEETAFLLLSKSADSCLVSWKSKNIIQTWNSIHYAFCDDFLQVGHNQVLILFSKVEDLSNAQFILTDLFCCEMDSTSPTLNEKQQDHQAEKSISSVVDALATNVQAMKAEIRQNELLFEKKNKLIKECWQSLDSMLINGDGTREIDNSDGLVTLFESDSGPVKAPSSSSSKPSRPLVVLDKRQAIVFDKWVVIVKLKNTSKRSITNVSLLLSVNNQVGESQVLSSSSSSQNRDCERGGHASKRTKTDSSSFIGLHKDHEITLAAKTNVPDFSKEKQIKALLMVNWDEPEHGQRKLRHVSCMVGSIELNSVDAIKGTYAVQDREFYEAACVRTEFCIISQNCDLASLESLLREETKSINCNVLVLDQNESLNSANQSQAGESSEISLLFSKSKMSVEVKMFSRNKNEANQLRHLITSLVPADSEITFPMETFRELVKRLSESLAKEHSIIKRFAEQGLETFENNDKKARRAEPHADNPEQDSDHVMETAQTQDQPEVASCSNSNAAFTANNVEQIRREFNKKRKRNESLVEENSTIMLDADTLRDYFAAIKESDGIAVLLFSFQGNDSDFIRSCVFNS